MTFRFRQRPLVAGTALAAALAFAGGSHAADDYPSRPVTLVVPSSRTLPGARSSQ